MSPSKVGSKMTGSLMCALVACDRGVFCSLLDYLVECCAWTVWG